MMTGLIIGGMAPLQAIKFQLLVVFIHTTATIMSALIATYLSYGQFFNASSTCSTYNQYKRQ